MKYFFTFLFLLYSIVSFCQNSQVKVTLKSGLTITGDLKELIPTDYVKMDVSGVETKVSMNDVSSIETIGALLSSDSKEGATDKKKLEKKYGNYIITDLNDYPEIVTILIGGKEMELRLVRGGSFIMGFDGRHSVSMDSEPLHLVHLSSFYVSNDCITRGQVNNLIKKKPNLESPNSTYHANKWKQADEIVKAIANSTNLPFRLCTEAEWEYCSLMDFADVLFGTAKYYEWCSDFWGKYSDIEQTNPQGPAMGKKHVERSYNVGKGKWSRSFHHNGTDYNYLIRIAISADKIANK